MSGELDVVTGAFSYTGKYIVQRLFARGRQVKTLTNHPDRPNPFGGRVSVAPLDFSAPDRLADSLRGAATLYNTYWVRFAHGQVTYERAVENTKTLIRAANEAGVSRIVHVSITNPSATSPLPYFKGKAILEQVVMDSGLSYAILRPTVIFGPEDILINNIAWTLRHLPVFAMIGDGRYRLQPIFVEDMADLAVEVGQSKDNQIINAVGSETFSFDQLVRLIARRVGSSAKIINMPPELALFLSRLIGLLVGDVILTKDEVDGLMANLLVSGSPPTGKKSLSEWLAENANRLGVTYASELRRHYR